MQTVMKSLAFVLLLLPAVSYAAATPMGSEERIVRLEKLLTKTQDIFDLNFSLYRRDMIKALELTRKEIEPLRDHTITRACSNGVKREKNCLQFGEVVDKILRDAINSHRVGKIQNSYSESVSMQFQKILNDPALTTATDPELGFFVSRSAEDRRLLHLAKLREDLLKEGTDALLAIPSLGEDKIVALALDRPLKVLLRQPSSQAYDVVSLIQVAIDQTLKEVARAKIDRPSK